MACIMRARSIGMTVGVGVLAVLFGGCGESPGLGASFDYVVPAGFEFPNSDRPRSRGRLWSTTRDFLWRASCSNCRLTEHLPPSLALRLLGRCRLLLGHLECPTGEIE